MVEISHITKLPRLAEHVYSDGNIVYKTAYFDNKNPYTLVEDPEYGNNFPEVIALQRVQEIRGFQQFVSFEGGILQTKLITGDSLKSLHERGDRPQYTDQQLEDFIRTLLEMDKNGVGYDQKPKNIVFHPSQGFTQIDYELGNPVGIMLFPILFGISGG